MKMSGAMVCTTPPTFGTRYRDFHVKKKKTTAVFLNTRRTDRRRTELSVGGVAFSAFPTGTLALDASTHRAWVRGIVHRGHEHDVRVFVEQVLRAVAARAHRAGGVVHQHGDAASARHQKVVSFFSLVG
jgi:hypothetical protein